MGAYLSLTITDLPGNWSAGGFAGCPIGVATRTVWCHLPADWVVDGVLRPCRRRFLLDSLRRPANGADADRADAVPADPERYVVLEVRARVLDEREARNRPWLGDRADFRRYDPDGSHRHVDPGDL